MLYFSRIQAISPGTTPDDPTVVIPGIIALGMPAVVRHAHKPEIRGKT